MDFPLEAKFAYLKMQGEAVSLYKTFKLFNVYVFMYNFLTFSRYSLLHTIFLKKPM